MAVVRPSRRRINMKPPPPRLPAAGYVTASAKATAMAASTAFPPRFKMSTPTSDAILFVEATIPFGARTGSREAATATGGRATPPSRRGASGAPAINMASRNKTVMRRSADMKLVPLFFVLLCVQFQLHVERAGDRVKAIRLDTLEAERSVE